MSDIWNFLVVQPTGYSTANYMRDIWIFLEVQPTGYSTANYLSDISTFLNHVISIVCLHEYCHYHSEQLIKYHDTGYGRSFVSASV